MIKGKVQKRNWAKDEKDLEFKINGLELLSEARQKMTKTFNVRLDSNEVSTDFVEKFHQIIEEHPGSCALRLILVDNLDKIQVKVPSRKGGIEISNEFLKKMNELGDLHYFLNDRMTR